MLRQGSFSVECDTPGSHHAMRGPRGGGREEGGGQAHLDGLDGDLGGEVVGPGDALAGAAAVPRAHVDEEVAPGVRRAADATARGPAPARPPAAPAAACGRVCH
jgi:hypothetical protein